jgi:hypothetical protein
MLAFRATFYLNRGVPADDEVTSLGAIGGSAQNGAVASLIRSPSTRMALLLICRPVETSKSVAPLTAIRPVSALPGRAKIEINNRSSAVNRFTGF